jgi:hypothetical protein
MRLLGDSKGNGNGGGLGKSGGRALSRREDDGNNRKRSELANQNGQKPVGGPNKAQKNLGKLPNKRLR